MRSCPFANLNIGPIAKISWTAFRNRLTLLSLMLCEIVKTNCFKGLWQQFSEMISVDTFFSLCKHNWCCPWIPHNDFTTVIWTTPRLTAGYIVLPDDWEQCWARCVCVGPVPVNHGFWGKLLTEDSRFESQVCCLIHMQSWVTEKDWGRNKWEEHRGTYKGNLSQVSMDVFFWKVLALN